MSTKKAVLPVRPSAIHNGESASPTKALQNTCQASSLPTAKKSPSPIEKAEHKTGPATKLTIRYDAGFPNVLYLRGQGASLSWEKGIPLKNVKADQWVWETTAPFTTCEFKVLINDREYEIGDNHHLSCGAVVAYTPQFP